MSLHHRREMSDMRSAYGRDQAGPQAYPSESISERSYFESHNGTSSYSRTPPKLYSSSSTKRSPIVHNDSDKVRDNGMKQFFDDRHPNESPRSSVETYASTVQSEEELLENVAEYKVPEFTARPYESQAIVATPSEFSELFPSCRRLAIHHDDTTIDGNMNLQLDTPVTVHGRKREMTLFHLRMHDLKNREFSLRRYCRDSGREVCHSSAKQRKSTADKRPGLQRSLSNAINSMWTKSEHKRSSGPNVATLSRHDSGYGSMHSMDFDDNNRPRSSGQGTEVQDKISTNIVHLEFSNYAQVDVKRAGNSNKRYDFEYWGIHYSWKRVFRKDRKETSFQLTKAGGDDVLAQIVPIALTPRQAEEEQSKGGWIRPCSMWIADESIVRTQKDLSDVVVAAGFIALVDDSIRARFHSQSGMQLLIPVPKLSMDMEYVGPKRLINEMFNRHSVQAQHPTGGRTSAPEGGERI